MKKIILISILFLTSLQLISQTKFTNDRSSYYTYGSQFFAEAVVLPHEDADSIRVIIYYKIMNDVLSFQQIKDNKHNRQYMATSSVEAIIKDKTGIIREHSMKQDTIYVDTFEKTNSKTDYTVGYMEGVLPEGKFTGEVKLYDRYAQKIEEEELEFGEEHNSFDSEAVFAPFFVQDNSGDYSPLILGGNISFKKNNLVALLPVAYAPESKKYNYIISKKEASETGDWQGEVNLSGQAEIAEFSNIIPSIINDKIMLQTECINTPERVYKAGFLIIKLPDNAFIPGQYVMKIYQNNSSDTSIFKFRCIWENMPLSLNNIDYAIELMYYILTEDEFDDMQDGNSSEKFLKLLDFWKTKDPTPETPYNEAMEVYFSRVDYAFFNYATISAPDGALTDRGKIFILFGPPDIINDKLTDGTSYEIWTYENFDKVFTFEITDPGTYQLVKIVDENNKEGQQNN